MNSIQILSNFFDPWNDSNKKNNEPRQVKKKVLPINLRSRGKISTTLEEHIEKIEKKPNMLKNEEKKPLPEAPLKKVDILTELRRRAAEDKIKKLSGWISLRGKRELDKNKKEIIIREDPNKQITDDMPEIKKFKEKCDILIASRQKYPNLNPKQKEEAEYYKLNEDEYLSTINFLDECYNILDK